MADPKIYIRRSGVPNKVPTTDQLALGELAINTNDGKLYLEKDPNGVGIGTTVVAVNPWNVGVGSLAYDIYFDAGDVGINTDSATQTLDVRGDVRITGGIYDTNDHVGSAGSVLSSTGSGWHWVTATASVTIGDDPPSSPAAGDLWWESDTGRLKIYYNDGNSSQWVDTASGITDFSTALGGRFVTDSIGINTVSNVGLGTTAKAGYQLYVEGDARVTGVLTIGQGSITLNAETNTLDLGGASVSKDSGGDIRIMGSGNAYAPVRASVIKVGIDTVIDGDKNISAGVGTFGSGTKIDGPNNLITVGTALTLGHTQGLQFHTQNLHASGFEVNNLNVSGIVTASKVDAPVEGAVNTTGVITATGGIKGIGIYSGSNTITAGVVTSLNFIGAGNTFKYTNGKVDISIAGGGVAISTEAPTGPNAGDLWWDNDTGNMAIYYDDESGSPSAQWVSVAGVGPRGAQGVPGAASTTGYPGTIGQLLQHDGSSFVGIASTGFRDYVINQGQGYYAYTTDYYTVGVANTTQEIVEGEWTLIQPQVASDGLYNHQPTCMDEANSGAPWVGTGATVGTGQTEFSLAGTKPGTSCIVRSVFRFEPDTDETDLDMRLHFTTNTATQGTGLTNFNIEKQALVMTVGAAVTYTSETLISFFVGDTLYGDTKADAGSFCVEVNGTTDGTLEILGLTVMVDI